MDASVLIKSQKRKETGSTISNSNVKIPRKLFVYWDSGFADAPRIVRRCKTSWQVNNPGWEIMLLDDTNVHEYTGRIEIPCRVFDALPIQKKANMIRLKLLLDHGGVWADATLFCNQPLDSWIDEATRGGAFMFDNPGPDREIANWFIAAKANNYLIHTLYVAQCQYWTRNDFNHESFTMLKVKPLLSRILNRRKSLTRFWFTPLATRILRVYAYHIFHHHFYWLMCRDRRFAKVWHDRRPYPAREAALIQRLGMTQPLTEEARSAIDSSPSPVFKLSYKFDQSAIREGSVLDYLFSVRPS